MKLLVTALWRTAQTAVLCLRFSSLENSIQPFNHVCEAENSLSRNGVGMCPTYCTGDRCRIRSQSWARSVNTQKHLISVCALPPEPYHSQASDHFVKHSVSQSAPVIGSNQFLHNWWLVKDQQTLTMKKAANYTWGVEDLRFSPLFSSQCNDTGFNSS